MWKKQSIFRLLAAILLLVLFVGSVGAVEDELEIEKIEINQAIGIQKDNHLNFVAGKNTVVRAIMTEPITISKRKLALDGAATQAVVKRNGQVVTTLAPKSTDQPTRIIDFLCPSLSACGNWAAGSYEFEVTVKGVTESTAGTDYIFKERRSARILAVPVKARYHNTITTIPAGNKWRTSWDFMRDVYPVADKGILWTVGKEVDASAKKYDLEGDGQLELWKKLSRLMPLKCEADPEADGCYDLIVGFISDNPDGYPEGTLAGFTYGSPVNVVVAKDDAVPATVAHEIGHVLGELGDTYEGGHFRCNVNPAPNGMEGIDWDTEQTTFCKGGKQAFPCDEGLGATKIPANVHPYDVNGRGALRDMACLMGSAGSQRQIWITPESYDQLFAKLAPPKPILTNFKSTAVRLVRYAGFITKNDNSVLLDPWESFLSTVDIPDTTGGNFTIKALSDEGTVLATKKLDVRFSVSSITPTELTKAPFNGAMRFPSGTAKFQIERNQDGKVLLEFPVSPVPPSITDVTPNAPGEISGIYTIHWNATAPDGTPLYARVEYNPDFTNSESQWVELAAGLEESQWEEDFDELPGGPHARIRVTVTDGVNASSAESSEFTVPLKTPSVFIDDLAWGDEYEIGDEILLEAEAYDLQDEWLPDDKLSWVSNISGFLGTGSRLLVYNLPAGEHEITVTAQSSAGLSGTDTVALRVSPCSFRLTHQQHTFEAGASNYNVVVGSAGASKCTLNDDDLSVQTNDEKNWIKAKVVRFRRNRGVVRVSVSPNPTVFERTGFVEIVGQTFKVKQKGAPCNVAVSPQMKFVPASGGTGIFTVSAPGGCTWSIDRNAGWITTIPGKSGRGKEHVRYIAKANRSGKPRVAEITVTGAGDPLQKKVFTLYQLPHTN